MYNLTLKAEGFDLVHPTKSLCSLADIAKNMLESAIYHNKCLIENNVSLSITITIQKADD